MGHLPICLGIVEKPQCRLHYPSSIRSHQARYSGFDDFRPFGVFAEHEKRFAKRGCFFLNAAGVRQYQRRGVQQPYQFRVIDRRHQKDPLNSAWDLGATIGLTL